MESAAVASLVEINIKYTKNGHNLNYNNNGYLYIYYII